MPRRRRFRPNYPLWLAVVLFLGAIAAYIGLGVLLNGMSARRPGMPSGLYLAFVARCLDATLAVWFLSVGASIGSFLNVVAYRLPLGRTLNGHSACPFCTTQIAASDNIPVFAWLRLRGRCRTCRLPISIQYPLVELAVGLVFLAMYFLEFAVAGTNVPGTGLRPEGIGLVWMSVTRAMSIRLLLALYLISGLVAAALMIVRGSRVPVSLFLWLALVLVVVPLVWPEVIVVPWWGLPAKNLSVMDAGLTLLCGLGGGWILGALTLPLVVRADNKEGVPADGIQSEAMTAGAWMGSLASLGILVGWQSMPLATAWILAAALISQIVLKLTPWRDAVRAQQPIVWAWLGLVLFRGTWKLCYESLHKVHSLPPWTVDLLPLIAVFPLAWLVRPRADRPSDHSLPPST